MEDIMSKKNPPPEPVVEQETCQTDREESPALDLDALQESLAQAELNRDEYLTLAQRVQADFDNYRRRNRQIASDSFDDGARAFIKTILPVCDNLERALKEERENDSLYDGVLMVQRLLQEALSQRGIQEVSRLGEPFDPNLEDAVAQGTREEGEPGMVCEVVQKGYKMGEQILRHAMVRVVSDLNIDIQQ
jgi:molecular chaperone GrpE